MQQYPLKQLTQKQIKDIKTNPAMVDWYWLSKYNELPEYIMREYKEYLWWYCICKYQKLSESFAKEMQYMWKDISCMDAYMNRNYHNVKIFIKLGKKLNDNIRKGLQR